MPAVRLARRRRSSIAFATLHPSKVSSVPRAFTFAPNVTPGTYIPPERDLSDDLDESGEPGSPSSSPSSPAPALFPPSSDPAPASSRRRAPPGKRRSLGYIPRPPNAFMLFRADFVRQKHVPGSIETNHGSLSKIIGNCWRSLPLEERNVWEQRARVAKAEHKLRYPEYRFRPVHNKEKKRKAQAAAAAAAAAAHAESGNKDPEEEEARCQEVAALLMEGKKGEELREALERADADRERARTAYHHNHQSMYGHRRSSSVPLPTHPFNPISIPQLHSNAATAPSWFPHFPHTNQHPMRAMSPGPAGSVMRGANPHFANGAGLRRASSTQPVLHRSWTFPGSSMWFDPASHGQTGVETEQQLPDVDGNFVNPFPTGAQGGQVDFNGRSSFNFDNLLRYLPSDAPLDAVSPLENIAPHQAVPHLPPLDTSTWMSVPDQNISAHSQQQSESHPSSTYSGSPNLSPSFETQVLEAALAQQQQQEHQHAQHHQRQVHAPQPQHAFPPFQWSSSGPNGKDDSMTGPHNTHDRLPSLGLGLNFGLGPHDLDGGAHGQSAGLHAYTIGLADFNIGMGGLVCVDGAQAGGLYAHSHEEHEHEREHETADGGFELLDYIHEDVGFGVGTSH
ncbi:hypothetical protein BD410DRAFT_744069 [Rickenella mellea]|uniref:HMG box domain-containing protein n=1 Tax=Rickenella mellea TaxID=50990 RepID=A0A4Y7QDI4_9AGAM|nr:hypothetical protein BD410DRAFT_744069 [Rickenella mellea]